MQTPNRQKSLQGDQYWVLGSSEVLRALRFIGGGGGGFFARDGGGGGAFFFPSFVSNVDQLAVLDGVLVYEVGLSDLPLK